MDFTLSLTEKQHRELRSLLYPGDGCEAVAIALCGRHAGDALHRLLVHRVVPLPPEALYLRAPDQVRWRTPALIPVLEQAAKRGLAILKLHSHPGGFAQFSAADDRADGELFASVHAWTDDGQPHGSAVMLPDGEIFGRAHLQNGTSVPFARILCIGDDIRLWGPRGTEPGAVPEFARRNAQAFGDGTHHLLQALRVAVVGCSGTGCFTIELLARLFVGHLVLVDPDRLEEKNLNRIAPARRQDVGKNKAEFFAEHVRAMDLGTRVSAHPADLSDRDALRAVASCDLVFGCMDSADGRHLLNRIATFYSQPYLDLGVRLEADGNGGIDQICGSVHYLRPGGSTLLSRGVYTADQLRAEILRRTDPGAYAELLEEKYIAGVAENRPAVAPVNALYAARGVLELLARVHELRLDSNSGFSVFTESLTGGFNHVAPDGEPDPALARHVGRGDMNPLLDLPVLGSRDIER